MWQPRNPDFAARTRASFADQAVMATLGIAIADISPGLVALEMPFRADLVQQHGFLHAGVITTALDSACGYAAFSLMEEDAEVLTVEFKSSFLAPAKGLVFRFEGQVIRAGRTLMFTEGKTTNEKGTLISTLSATMMAVRKPL
ncbi:MAG: PaaI family thioesterase [Pseudomonadota bacterium]